MKAARSSGSAHEAFPTLSPYYRSRFFLGQSFVSAGFESRTRGAVLVSRVLRGCYAGRRNPISDAPFNNDWIVGKTRSKTSDVLMQCLPPFCKHPLFSL